MIQGLNEDNYSEKRHFSGGWMSIYKPKEISSFSALKKIKKKFLLKKIGYAGTLDPLASGVLPVAFGAATKTIPYLMEAKKKYKFSIKWGVKTCTHDLEGKVIGRSDSRPSKESLLKVIKVFDGEIYQKPPRFSAVKVNGKRAYQLARGGEQFSLDLKKVKIYNLILSKYNKNKDTEFIISCSKGFYIRSLVRDICKELGVLGTVSMLERLEVGPFSLENTFSLENIENLVHIAPAGMVGGNLLIPLSEVLDDIPAVPISDLEAERFQQGQIILNNNLIEFSGLGSEVLLLNNKKPLGLAIVGENSIKPKKVFSEEIFNLRSI